MTPPLSGIRLYDSLRREKSDFIPLNPPNVKMYACGITPWSDSHLGHGVAAIRFDAIRRYLEYRGYNVTYVQNVTNVDDKLIVRGKETGESPISIGNRYTAEYRELMKTAGVKPPSHEPDVITYIPQIIKYIEDLVASGHAYATGRGNVYFSVESFPEYGRLSGRDRSKNLEGTRVSSEDDKKEEDDFALWKADDHPEMSWDSPWGRGRPGWHIECSVMSNSLLGAELDIHCGGLDLMFPHHENEIAQCEAHNNVRFVRYWVHSGLLKIGGQKMSKSLGNYITLGEALDKYGPDLMKFTILRYHYRSEINLEDSIFEENLNVVLKFSRAFNLADSRTPPAKTESRIADEFRKAMDDEINTPRALVVLQSAVDEGLMLSQKGEDEKALLILSTARELARSMGLWPDQIDLEKTENSLLKFQNLYLKGPESLTAQRIRELIEERRKAREEKDYAKGDAVRMHLESAGISLLDVKGAPTEWMFKVILK